MIRPEDVPDDISDEAVAALGGWSAPDADLPITSDAEQPTVTVDDGVRLPVFGAQVLLKGQPAQVLVVYRAGDPDSPLDLVIKHGPVPQVLLRQPHSVDSGWCWPNEVPPPPPTLAEKLRAAAQAGMRVPKVGETVVLVQSTGFGSLDPDPFFGRRAQIIAIRSIDDHWINLDLMMFRLPEPPESSFDPDPLWEMPFTHQAGPIRPGEYGAGWAWPGWKSPARRSADELLTKLPCTRCKVPFPHSRRIRVFATCHLPKWKFSNEPTGSTPVAELCTACAEQVFEFATMMPPDAPVLVDAPGHPNPGETG